MTTQSLESNVIKKTLANGLTVLIKEDHSSPIVAVNAWFGVGSVNETEAMNGLAHFQEHMVFKGTKKYGVGEIANIVKGAGGNLNAGTSFSYTMYYIVLPALSFQTALEVQADAMMNSTFDKDEFVKERLVVIDEARMYDDRPESFTFYRTMELGFQDHNYRRPIAGYQSIVENITRDQLVDFYDNYYRPSNAVLVVVGDIDPDDALSRIEKVYGSWEAGTVEIGQPPVEPPQTAFRFKAYEGSMDHAYLGVGFHVPNILHEDYPALEMLSELLSSGRSSRLYRTVVDDKQLVTSVSASLLAERWPGFFLFFASMPTEKKSDARRAIFAEIERFKHETVADDELQKARRQLERSEYKELETMEGQASNMGYYQLLGDYRLADRHREAIKQVTAEKVMDVARRYFHPDNLSVVSYAPGKGSVTETEADALAMVQEVLSADGGITDMSGSPDPSTLAGVEDTVGDRVDVENREDGSVERFDLANGVRVVVKRRTTVPTVSMVSVFQGGGRFEPKGKSGIAMLTHRSLIKGSASYNADEIVQQVEGLGGSIDSYASFDTGGTAMGILSEFLDEALPIYKDVVRNPKFAPDRVEQERTRLLEELAQRHDNPIHLTMDELFGRVFGDHPYAYPFLGKQDEVQQLTAEDCAAWYRSLLVPANVVVSFVGDIDRDHAEKIANELYGDLKAGPVRTPEFTVAENPMQSGEFIIERPDLKQGVTFVGFLAPRMMTDDSLALQVLNGVLTGLGGRLFVELRDKRSLGYMTGSALNPLFERSIFFGYANPGADGLSEAVRVIFHELDLVARAEVTDEEFTRSKEWLLGSQVMQLQKNGAQASAYGTYEALGFGWEVVDKAPERIQRVTKAEMMRVAEEVFKPEHAVVVKMVPGS